MKFTNRGFLIIKPKQPFFEWANQHDEDFNDLSENEATVYLIEDDFYEDEPILKSHFKEIFLNELLAVTEDEELYPEIKWDIFNDWFSCELGTTVFDTQSSNLVAD